MLLSSLVQVVFDRENESGLMMGMLDEKRR